MPLTSMTSSVFLVEGIINKAKSNGGSITVEELEILRTLLVEQEEYEI